MKPSRRDQTILGIGLSICGALFLLSGTIPNGLGLVIGIVGIAVLGSRPDEEPPVDPDAAGTGTVEGD